MVQGLLDLRSSSVGSAGKRSTGPFSIPPHPIFCKRTSIISEIPRKSRIKSHSFTVWFFHVVRSCDNQYFPGCFLNSCYFLPGLIAPNLLFVGWRWAFLRVIGQKCPENLKKGRISGLKREVSWILARKQFRSPYYISM